MKKEPVNAMTTRALLLLLAAASLAACSGQRADSTDAPRRASPCAPPASSSATCRTRSSSRARSSRAPRCRSWPRCRPACCASQRDEGARVAKGEVLAVLDETDYRLANDRARAALAVAEANRAHAQAEKDRADSLLKTGGITDRDHLSAQVALQVADAGLAQARAEVAIAGQQLARTRVRAPFTGRIGKRFPDPGSMLAAGVPLFTLVDDSVLEFEAQVPSRDFAKVKLGAPVQLAIDALPDVEDRGPDRAPAAARRHALALVRRRGRRCPVAPTSWAGSSRAPRSWSAPPRRRSSCRPPRSSATAADPTKAEIFVVRQGKAEKHTITVGVETPDGIQATNGLVAGDAVVLDPPTSLADGAPVEAQNGRAAAPKQAAN